MAENFVQVTEGTGKKLHTYDRVIGANTVHDEAVFPAEYPLATYWVPASGVSIATVDDHVLAIMAGASLNLRVRRIRIEQQANATTATLGLFELRRLTTAGSGGTVVTPLAFDTADPAAGATARALPSTKGTEGTLLMRSSVLMRSAVGSNGQAEDWWEWTQLPNEKPFVIAAGTSNGFCIKSVTAIAAATVIVNVELVETSF